jgi:hypothetical protein
MPENKIRFAEPPGMLIRDTSPTLPLVDPVQMAAALGAEPTPQLVPRSLSPMTRLATRAELFRRLLSDGRQVGLPNPSHRPTISISDGDWAQLEKLASALTGPEGSPSAGQVGSVLLSMAIRSVTTEIEKSLGAIPSIARELAAKTDRP